MTKTFKRANDAYEYYFDKIIQEGVKFGDTKALFNVGFYIEDPLDHAIENKERSWNPMYAEAEWQWYRSGDRNISKLGDLYGTVPMIWQRMADSDGNVNSNYGWQWKRNDQIDYVIDLLKHQPDTRQAAISIYDCKEHNTFTFDTPCTYAVQFTILDNKLNMSVVMRSNDLWYGFCNDQYQFSKLQHYVWNRLNHKDVEIGTYFHFAHNLHLYNNKL